LHYENMEKAISKNKSDWSWKTRTSLTFREWKQKISRIRKFIAINPRQEDNRRILSSDYYIRFTEVKY